MADKTGYIGRNPNDSAVTVARQFFTASGVTTTFTFASGYLTGYLDVYVDGVKRRVADEFTATDGSTFDVLQGGVSAGSTVEAVAYKAFNAAATVGDVTGNFNVSGNTTLDGSLGVTGGTTLSNLNVTGITTLGAGTSVGFANTAFNISGTPDISVDLLSAVDINVSGAATIGGILTYEDVTNIDSVGIVTARTGVEVTANGLVVNAGVSTFAADVSIADKIVHTGDTNTAIRFPSADTITAETAGVERLRIDSNGDVGLVGIATATGLVVVAGSGVYAGHTGVVTAVTFDGNVTGNQSGGSIDATTGAFSGVVTLQNNLDLQDDDKILLGTGDDLQIYHDGTDSYIDDAGTGELKIRSNVVRLRKYTGETMAVFVADGGASLYHDNSKKLETMSGGIDVTGELECDALDVDGSSNFAGDVRVVSNIQMGSESTSDAELQIGTGLTGNRNSYIDLIGDTTYTDYGLRIIRKNGGANANSQIAHRGTGALQIMAQENGTITFSVNGSNRVTVNNTGATVTGTCAATSFSGDGSALSGVGGESDITSSLFS